VTSAGDDRDEEAKAPIAAPPGTATTAERRPGGATTAEFLAMLQRRERGKLKVYIGSSAGTGKTFRMLQEAHALRKRGVDIVIGFVETHGREETAALIGDLEVVPRQQIAYRGVTLEEMDLGAVIERRPQLAIVDELAHTNVPTAGHRKRWEDVMALLDEGISVISAVNVQHLESLNDVIQRTLGVTVRETVPDWVVASADQVVNLDISAEDLRQRLMEGKIYPSEKIPAALSNFFTPENLTTLRELALREVASSVDRVREELAAREAGTPAAPRAVDRLLVAMSSDPVRAPALLRTASRIAGRLNSDWYCVYVQTPDERADRIDAALQRKLVDNMQLAQSMGAEVITLAHEDVVGSILRFAEQKGATLLIIGQEHRSQWRRWRRGSVVDRLVKNTLGFDVLVVSAESGGDQ
jgi:two-component system sensor histidine kinase KdpD